MKISNVIDLLTTNLVEAVEETVPVVVISFVQNPTNMNLCHDAPRAAAAQEYSFNHNPELPLLHHEP